MNDERNEYAIIFAEDMDTAIDNLIPVIYEQIKDELGAGEKTEWAVLGAGVALAACKSTLKMMQNIAANNMLARIKPEQIN